MYRISGLPLPRSDGHCFLPVLRWAISREVSHLAPAADKPHIRSIFFRVRKLLLAGIQLVAVTDGVCHIYVLVTLSTHPFHC